MKNRAWKYIIAILAVIFFVGTAVEPVAVGFTTAQAASVAPKTDGKQNWDSVLAAAKKEGKLSLYSMWAPQVRIALTEAFKAKYGIEADFMPFSRGQEILARVQTEQRAGLYLADVFGTGASSLITAMKPEGVLGPLEPLLSLPEVTDGKYWRGGRVPFIDRDKTSLGMIASLPRYIIYNTGLIKKGEITTFKDLLKPQYKGMITLNDPRVSGSGKDCFVHLALNVWNFEEAKAYLAQLVKKQEVAVERDNRQHVDSVARGKYAIGLGSNPDNLISFIGLGAPVDAVILKEGVVLTAAAGCVAVPSKLSHPNAAKVFLNWLLGKEGQTVFAKSFGNPSLRTDVSTAGINPLFLPHSQEKIFTDTEDTILFSTKMMSAAKEIIDDASK